MQSDTLPKMLALREAKRLGCSGAHQTEDGKWHPCSSAEVLRSINPKRLRASASTLIAAPQRPRNVIGSAKIRKQWEQLGQRGIVAIDTISGGGLVSGAISKSLVPGSPLDDDPDVYDNIETARLRSRQLGCIGVSRRVSRSGRTVWMPCTNMTDLSNRTGRTALGRRNLNLLQQRFVTDALKRREQQERPRRLRKKSLLEDLHGIGPINKSPYRVKAFTKTEYKALGPKLGRGLRSAPPGMTFVDVTGAIDADKDGIVFEGQPLERPIIPRFILPDNVARRVQKLIQGQAENNEKQRRLSGSSDVGNIDESQLASLIGTNPQPVNNRSEDQLLSTLRDFSSRSRSLTRQDNQQSPDTWATEDTLPPVDAGLSFDRRALKLGKRLAKTSFSRIDDPGDAFRAMSLSQLEDVVRRAIPTNEVELEATLKTNPYTRKNWEKVLERISVAQPDWSAQKAASNLLVKEVQRSPLMASMVREYGLPPIIASEWQPDIQNLSFTYSSGPSDWNTTIGGWSGAGFIGLAAGIFEKLDRKGRVSIAAQMSSDDPAQTMRHELAHAWETMAARRGGPAFDHYVAQYQELAEGLMDIFSRNENDFRTSYHSVPWGTEQEHRSALKISDYAETARIEWFAEAFAAFTSEDNRDRAKVDSLSIQNMAAVLGKTVAELMALSNDFSFDDASFAVSARSKKSPVAKLYDINSRQVKDALAFIQQNPSWVHDAPSDVLALLTPNEIKVSLDEHISYMSSMRSSLINVDQALRMADKARRNNELGQQIIDSLMKQATKGNSSSTYPTLWFIGGTTGSGKSTLRSQGVFTDIPRPSEAVDIDPDIIKSLHPQWRGGQGAQELHRWSTQWTRYGLSQALAQERDAVVTGTGVRTEQLSAAKSRGYLTVGHFVYVPVDQAQKQMRTRAQDGGTNLPEWFADRYAADLQRVIPRAVTAGDLDEFFLWDNSGPMPKLAASRTRDGKYKIDDRAVFEAFLGKSGARYVEEYWKNNSDGPKMTSTDMSSRSVSYPRGASFVTRRGPGLISVNDIDGLDLQHSIFIKGSFHPNISLDSKSWFGAELNGIQLPTSPLSRPIDFESSRLISIDFSSKQIPRGSTFAFSKMRSTQFAKASLQGVSFAHSELRGVDFTGASLTDANFTGARLYDVDFSGADLTGAKIGIAAIRGSGMKWDADTKFPPEVREFIASQDIKSVGGKFMFRNQSLVKHLGSLASDEYSIIRPRKRTSREGIPSGRRTKFDDIIQRTPLGPVATDVLISDADLSYRQIDGVKLTGVALADSFLLQTVFTQADFNGVVFRNINAEGLSLYNARLQNVTFQGSNLTRARFRNARVVGALNLRNANLTKADLRNVTFGEGQIAGRLDLRGANLDGANLEGVDFDRVDFDEDTNFENAKGLPRKVLIQIAEWERRRGQRRATGSARSISSRSDALDAIGQISDAITDYRTLTPSRRTLLQNDVARVYGDLFKLAEKIDDLNANKFVSSTDLLSAETALRPLASVRKSSSQTVDLLQYVRSDRRQSFIQQLSDIRKTNPAALGANAPDEIWQKAIDDYTIELSALRSIAELDEDLLSLKEAVSTAPTLAYVLHSNFSDLDKTRNTDGQLPTGPKVGPQVRQSTRSIRDSLPLNTGTYFQDLLKDANFNKFFRSLEDNLEDENWFRARAEGFAYVFDTETRAFIDGEYDGLTAHPSIGSTVKDIVDQGQIIVFSDGTHSISMPPNPLLARLLPDKRDWSTVELPSRERVEEALARLNSRQRLDINEWSLDTNTEEARTAGNKIISQLFSRLDDIPENPTPVRMPSNSAPYITQYISLIHNPRGFLRGETPETLKWVSDPIALLHDNLGHFAIGRGFDRHGEWATALATLGLIENAPNLTVSERQAAAKQILSRFAMSWLVRRLNPKDEGLDKAFLDAILYQGDIFEIFDILDPSRTNAQSSRSSIRSMSPIKSPALMKDVGRDEIIGRSARSFSIDGLRNSDALKQRVREIGNSAPTKVVRGRGSRRSRLSPSEVDPVRPQEQIDTVSAQPSGQDASIDNQMSVRNNVPEVDLSSSQTSSSRSFVVPKAKPIVDWRKSPVKFGIDDDGNLTIVSGSIADLDIRSLDPVSLTINDIPPTFEPKTVPEIRRLKYRQLVQRFRRENALVVQDDGSLDASLLIDESVVGNKLSLSASTAIFSQSIAKNLQDGEAVILSNIPGDMTTSRTDTAVLFRQGRNLVLIEVDKDARQQFLNRVRDARQSAGGNAGKYSGTRDRDSRIEIFDIAQIERFVDGVDVDRPEQPSVASGSDGLDKLLREIGLLTTAETIEEIRKVILDHQALIADTDPDIVSPGIYVKRTPYNGFVPLPKEEIDRLGGEDKARTMIRGYASAETQSITMYAHFGIDATLVSHEWAHITDFYRGIEAYSSSKAIYNDGVPSLSKGAAWAAAKDADRGSGQRLLAQDEILRRAIEEKRVRMPKVISGTTVSRLGQNLFPIVGATGVTQYGTTNVLEDFAESVRLRLISRAYGHVLEEVDEKGATTGRTWNFEELYPERVKLIDSAIYSSRSKSGPRSDKFQQRFKDLNGHESPTGDGDCYVSAIDAISRLTSEEFGFDRTNIRVVHGIPLGTGGNAKGIRYGHAWVEVANFDFKEHDKLQDELADLMDEITRETVFDRKRALAERINEVNQRISDNEMNITVYDFSNGREIIYPRVLYYAVGNINKEDARYYSPSEAAGMMATNEHYGPWE